MFDSVARLPISDLARSVRILNAVDVIATLFVVCVLGAPEWNPVQARILEVSPVAFVLFKLGWVGLLTVCLEAAHPHSPRAVAGTLIYFNLLFLAALAIHVACAVTAVSHA